MVHTINYKDILAFKKSHTHTSKDYNTTIKKIFHKISDIKNDLKNDSFIIITFDETVKFVDPLFFILLFDLYYEHHLTLVIDTRYMEDKSQHYIQRILTQYSDLDKFQMYSPYAKQDNKDLYITIDIIAKTDNEERERQFKRFLEQDSSSIHLFSSVAYKKSLINDTQYEYTLLPILKLRNYKLKEIDTTIHEDSLEPYDKRINFYNKLSLENAKKDIGQYRADLQEKVEELLIAVGLNSRGLSNSFRDIFFELIDNIRKHTSEQTNAHISFRKDLVSNLYELIISDNSEKGFLNTYKETLEKEQNRLDKSGVSENLLQNYVDVVKDIDNKNYKKVLTGLFQIEKKHPKNSKDDIHIHQIPRIAMHFGLPLLVKLLEKLSIKESIATPELKLFLHNEDQYFEVTYSFKNKKFTLDVNDNSSHRKKGTYIIVTFPIDVAIVEANNSNTLININFQNNDYKLFLDKREIIEKQIGNFSFYLDKHIEEDLDIGTSHTYICENKCAFIKYTGHKTFSEFLRNIYLYAYKHDIEDIVVINVPLYGLKNNSENIEHIKLLEAIMYSNAEVEYEKSLNILFYSDREPEAILIGGRNQKEYCYLNQLLPNWYGASNKNSICLNKFEPLDKLLSSKLFVHLDEKAYMLPFELFEISDIDRRDGSKGDRVSILGNMLEKYLNEVAKKDNIHVDTGSGYHIDRYMEFKKIFEDSRWVKRLAFRLAMQFPKEPENRKYYLYGTDKYTNMLISLCYTFLDLTFDRFRYKLFNIYDSYDYKVLKEKIEKLNDEKTHEIYLISSVITSAKMDKEIIRDYGIRAIPAIQLDIGKERHEQINPLVVIKNDIQPQKIIQSKYCESCDTNRIIPLLEFTKDDPFFIKDTFFDDISKKRIISYSGSYKIKVKYFDSINFGHVERGNNHFLYYLNTIKFFNQNRFKIKKFLSQDVKKEINYNKKENIVLLTSSHDTNNNFVAMVNQEVFSNEAIVLSFNKSRGEANFHDLASCSHFDWQYTRVFFVDDSIASSHTLKYFYQLLRSIPNTKYISNIGLDGVIIMIDRISSYDETILCSYLKDNNRSKNTDKNEIESKLSNIYAFSSFDIKPIKSEVEECFMCKRNERYLDLAKKSVLDLMVFQMVKREDKLKKIPYREIQSAKDKPLVTRFKNYLKAMATIYIYQNFADKKYDEYAKFSILHEKFSKKMYNDIIYDKEERFTKYNTNVLKKIIEFQSEIALVKALSSPKLSYYYNIRKLAISTLLSKINSAVNDSISNKKFVLKYLLKSDIEKQEIRNDNFLDFYKNMTNLHLINTYFATLGYFEDSKILHQNYIRLYYQIALNDEVRNINDGSLLHTYPFAVKFTTSCNHEKANYFENNLNIVFNDIGYKGDERKKKFSYLNALRLENTLYWTENIKNKFGIDIQRNVKKLQKQNNPNTKIDKIKDIFQSIFGNLKVYMFISPHVTIRYTDYQAYLDDSENSLVNILDEYKNINSYDSDMTEIVKKVFYGAVSEKSNPEADIVLEKIDKKSVIDKIDCTWANDYNKNYSVVRLVSLNENILFEKATNIKKNTPVWFRPIGCIVVEKTSIDYKLHMELSRTILSMKRFIVQYIEKEFSYGVIQEAIQKTTVSSRVKMQAKIEMKVEYMNIISQVYHSAQEHIGIHESIDDFLKKDHTMQEYKQYIKAISSYTWGMKKLTSLSKLKNVNIENNANSVNINSILGKNIYDKDKDFIKRIRDFLSITKIFTTKLSEDTDFQINLCRDCNCLIPLEKDLLYIIIFELIFNALKRMREENESDPYIKIYTQKNTIIFANKYTNVKSAEKQINKINKISAENANRMGIATIKELLLNIKYDFYAEYDYDREEIKITIKEDEK